MSFFITAYHHATPHGVVTAVTIPDSREPVPDAVLQALPEQERIIASELKGYRQNQFVGGRMALRRAFLQIGVTPPPLLSTERGAPKGPEGYACSITHKNDLAIGMASRNPMGTLGVDLEDYLPQRIAIAKKVLTKSELKSCDALDKDRRWTAMLIRFSMKEAVYKALDPYVRRYVGFHEASVDPDLEGKAAITLNLKNSEGPFIADGRYAWLHGRLLTSVRILPAD